MGNERRAHRKFTDEEIEAIAARDEVIPPISAQELRDGVAVSAAGKGTPACDRMPGLTTMMYIAVRKVVMPATISVFVREPAARMPKNRSSAVLSCCVVAVVSIVLAYCFQC